MPRRRKSVAPLTEVQVLQREVATLRREIMQMKQPGPSTFQTDNHVKTVDPFQGQTMISHPGRHGRANAKSGFAVYHNNRMQNLNSGANFVIKVFADDEPVAVGDKAFVWAVPEDVDTLQLSYTEAFVTNAGTLCQVDLTNTGQLGAGNVAMLSTKISIVSGQLHSHSSTPLPVIITANSTVLFRDQIRIDVDAAGGRMGLGVVMVFL